MKYFKSLREPLRKPGDGIRITWKPVVYVPRMKKPLLVGGQSLRGRKGGGCRRWKRI